MTIFSKKTPICALMVIMALNSSLFADWKEDAKNWNKYDADKLLEEERKQYDVSNLLGGATLGSDVTGAVSQVNNVLGTAQSLGLDEYFGGAIGDAQSMLNMVNNDVYQDLLMKTGLEVLGAADNALLGICYEKAVDFSFPDIKMPEVKIDPCIKLDVGYNGADVCGALPDIPGYTKKSQKILEIEQKNVKLFCNGWDDMVQVETVPVEKKLLESDTSKSITDNLKIAENTNVTEKIKRTKIADVGDMSDFKFKKQLKDAKGNVIKDEFGQPKTKIIQPFKGVEAQDTEDKKNAYRYVKKMLEREAAEGKNADTVESSKKLTLAHLDKANVAFKNEHEYELARAEAIDGLNFIEKDVFDTHDEVLIFRTKVIEIENGEADVSKKVGQIKAEKDNLMIQYKKRVDKWLRIKESYYFEYEKEGIHAPTSYYIDSVTKYLKDDKKFIKRASLVRQIDKEMNQDAQHISMLRVKADMLIREFDRRLSIEIISNRKFDIAAAMESVGLSSGSN